MTKTMQEFKERWREKAEEIKQHSFDRNQCSSIMSRYKLESLEFQINKTKFDLDFVELQKIENDLALALEIAYENYRKEKRGFGSKIFGGKKEFTLFKPK